VLVGHSFGGLYMQTYAARYPDEVAGVALVDSSQPDQFSHRPEARDSYEPQKFAISSLLARIGVFRLLYKLSPAPPNCRSSSAQIDALSPSARQYLGSVAAYLPRKGAEFASRLLRVEGSAWPLEPGPVAFHAK
jgi:pimeloyl-ACP methyl ester carboxylesterase